MGAKVTKAVFPVAGLGTRFLPATKATPKEMMPVVDKPLIQYAVEEAIEAGIKELIFVTSWSKRAIEDHFDRNHELERVLKQRNKLELLEKIEQMIPDDVSCIYIRQQQPLGLGHAVLCAEPVVGKEPFAVLLADDLIIHQKSPRGCLSAMIDHYNQQQSSIVVVESVADEDLDKYGVISVKQEHDHLLEVADLVEKPGKEDAPSNYGVSGRYVLTADIFNHLRQLTSGKDGEIQLTDAIANQLKTGQVFGYPLVGQRFDCGHHLGYLKAIISEAKSHPEIGGEINDYLKGLD